LLELREALADGGEICFTREALNTAIPTAAGRAVVLPAFPIIHA
jgi:hypothetical protein